MAGRRTGGRGLPASGQWRGREEGQRGSPRGGRPRGAVQRPRPPPPLPPFPCSGGPPGTPACVKLVKAGAGRRPGQPRPQPRQRSAGVAVQGVLVSPGGGWDIFLIKLLKKVLFWHFLRFCPFSGESGWGRPRTKRTTTGTQYQTISNVAFAELLGGGGWQMPVDCWLRGCPPGGYATRLTQSR